jgi:Sulfotransferase family
MSRPTVRPLLHVGLHKSGTSWLQNHLFAGKARAGFRTCGNENDAKRELVRPHDLDFDPGRVRAFYQPRFDRIAAEGSVPVITAERLCGDMLFGAHDSARMAERLAATFPAGRVLIVIREQRRMLLSSYQQYVKMGGVLSLERYLHDPGHAHPWPCDLSHFDYERLIRHYHRLFGAENVLVLPLELFQADQHAFVARIVDFAGATPDPGALGRLRFDARSNRSLPAQTVAIKRHANYVLRSRLNPWAPIDGRHGFGAAVNSLLVRKARRLPHRLENRTRIGMQTRIQEAVGDRYRVGNARTSELIGTDLRQYGYDMPEALLAGSGDLRPAESVTGRGPEV